MRHVLESQQFDRNLIQELFLEADRLEKTRNETLKGQILASLFYEPSTRTRFSFESAMLRLGGQILSTENASEFSSAAKGETLEDSIRVIGNYCDIIVLRHFDDDAAARSARFSTVPIINAGSGAGQHPTQALLDLYTIQRERGAIEGITVTMIGDLRHGRTVRSLAYLLGKFSGVRICFVSPHELRIGPDIKAYLDRNGIAWAETHRLEQGLAVADVLYQTRIQRERFADPALYEQLKNYYHLDLTWARLMRPNAILMHPLPRNDEIAPEVDVLPQAVYFKQARYGHFIRMALLKWVLA